MKTKNTQLTQKLAIWAIPKSSYQIERDRKENPDADAFEFRVLTNSPWESGAVNVFEKEVTIEVPDGIDLTQRAIETLTKAKQDLLANVNHQIEEINKQIANLTLIEHTPDYEEGDSNHDWVPAEPDTHNEGSV
jgi:antitoxin component HigA of HigAB toxin-antitoxin module